jgi:tetratricopeptide (TPR) repeat protein
MTRKKHLGPSITGLTLSLSLALFSAGNLTAQAYRLPAFDQGKDRLAAGDYDAAATFFGEAIGMDPTDALSLLMRGECFYKMGNYKLAIQDLTDSLSYAPNNIRGLLLRGSCHSALGKDAMAILDYEAAIRMDESLAKRFFTSKQKDGGPGADYREDNTSDSGLKVHAIKNYQEAMNNVYPNGFSEAQAQRAANPTVQEPDASPATGLRTNRSHTGKNTDRIGNDNSAGNPSLPPISRGAIGSEQAIADPNKAGTGEVNNAQGMPYINTDAQNNADVLSSDTMPASKNRRYTESLDQDPDRGDIGPLAGTTIFTGDAKKAIIDYGQGLKLDPTNAEYYFRRARAYQALFKVNDAMSDFRDAISQSPNNARYYLGRASLFYQLGKTVLLQADIESARNCDPDLPQEIHFRVPSLPKGVTWASDGPN